MAAAKASSPRLPPPVAIGAQLLTQTSAVTHLVSLRDEAVKQSMVVIRSHVEGVPRRSRLQLSGGIGGCGVRCTEPHTCDRATRSRGACFESIAAHTIGRIAPVSHGCPLDGAA